MKYIMLINSIVNMGGGQKYCSNKVKELEKRGFHVFVFSSTTGEIILDDLKKYQNCIISEMRLHPRYFNKNVRKKIIERILKIIKWDENEDCLLDSADIPHAEWGELIAEKTRSKHICYLIDEDFRTKKEDVDFLLFKLKRHELYGTSDQSLSHLFEGYYQVRDNERFFFYAYCTNVVEDIECDLVDKITPDTINIGYFGRLDKPYIIKTIKKSMDFFDKHRDKRFNIILIGGADNLDIENNIRALVETRKNLKLFITGFLNPIPRKLLKCLDVCVASAGCAVVAHKCGVLTVTVNALTGDVAGIMGDTCVEGEDFRYSEPKFEIALLLEDILFNGSKCIVKDAYGYYEELENKIKREINWQLKQFERKKEMIYYNIESIKPIYFKFLILKIIITLFGLDTLNFIVFKILKK